MKIQFVEQSAATTATDLMVVGHFEEDSVPQGDLAELDGALSGAISDLIGDGDILGKYLETTLVHTLGKVPAKRILVVGLGAKASMTRDKVREVTAAAVKTARKLKAKQMTVSSFGLNGNLIDERDAGHAIAEGALLSAYQFNGYGEKTDEPVQLEQLDLLAASPSEALRSGVAHGSAFAAGTNFARNLTNIPGNMLTPTALAAQAVELANRYGMEYEVLDESDMERLGMGGLLAVAQGSQQPPRLIVLKYHGNPQSSEIIGYVGKGITFDSGGISIKPADGMDTMKMDMGGGAAVLGAMETIGQQKPTVNVIAVVAAAENMPSGSAYKPGDVIRTMSGKTIEVLNTDAEGRIVLADAVAYAKHLGAARIVDVATLTGAVVIALGHAASGLLTNDDSFAQSFLQAAEQAGEKVWQLPTYDEYKEQLKSDIADVKNIGGRPAGTITGGLFIGAFVGDTPWIHLDIAGTAWVTQESKLFSKGATGVMVRSLAQYAQNCSV